MSNRESFHGIEAESATDALSIAAANNKLAEIVLLLQDGADIDGVALYSGSPALCTAAGLGNLKVVKLLLDHGANINCLDKFDLTPLMKSCSLGKKKGEAVALYLIGAKADVSYVRQSDGMTALKFASCSCTGELVQALIDHGASVDFPANSKQSALMLAAREDNVSAIEVLVKNGADLNQTCTLPWALNMTALDLARLEGKNKAAKYLSSLMTAD